MISIRRGLTRTNAFVVFLVVAVLCAGGVTYLRHWQVAHFREGIATDLRVVANSVKV